MAESDSKPNEPNDKRDQSREQTDKSYQNKKANLPERDSGMSTTIPTILTLLFAFLLVVSAFMTFGAICFQAWIYNCQLKEMQKSTEAATRAAKAAEDNISLSRDNMRLDQRAWVAPTGKIEGVPVAGAPYSIRMGFKNTGKTIAKNVGIIIYLRSRGPVMTEPHFDPVPKTEDWRAGGVVSNLLLVPSGEYTARVNNIWGEVLSDKISLDFSYGERHARIYIWGKVTYFDIFDVQHWTTFCSYFDKDGYSTYFEFNDTGDGAGPAFK